MKKLLLGGRIGIGIISLLLFAPAAYAAQADLSWSNPNGAQVRVERRDSLNPADPWVVRDTLPAGATSFSETGLGLNADYCYRPVAFSDFGDAAQPWPEVCANTRRPGNVNGIILIIRPEAGE